MAFDINGQYQGTLFGQDRTGETTPDLTVSDTYRPFFPVPYPAPYLPVIRQDHGHPVGAGFVISSQMLVGADASGAFVPAGLLCGKTGRSKLTAAITQVANSGTVTTITATNAFVVGDTVLIAGLTSSNAPLNGSFTIASASGTSFTYNQTVTAVTANAVTGATATITSVSNPGQYDAFMYGTLDVNMAYNPITGTLISTPGEVAVIAAPSDAVPGDVITFPNGSTYTVTSNDITNAYSCQLFPAGYAQPIGVATRNIYQYIGGTVISSTSNGMVYTLTTVNPVNNLMHNTKYEMGTALQTSYHIRLPWIGADQTDLQNLAASLGITYTQSDFSRSFAHFTGSTVQVAAGLRVVASQGNNGRDAGHYTAYNPSLETADKIVGRILSVQALYPIKDGLNRVRTLFDPSRLGGPYANQNPAAIMMGGSATQGLDYPLSVSTNALFAAAVNQGKSLDPRMYTYVNVLVQL